MTLLRVANLSTFVLGALLPLDSAWAFDGFGEWRGSAQYIVNRHGDQGPALQEIVQVVLKVEVDGKITGISTDNGCRLGGIGAPMGANVMTVDITLRECRSVVLNRRFSGTLAHYPPDKRVALSLQVIDTRSKPVATYEVKATTLRR
jgi:hypothetical protein